MILVGATGTAAWAQSAGAGVGRPIAEKQPANAAPLEQGVMRSHAITIDLSALGVARKQLLADPASPRYAAVPTFDNETLILVITRVEAVGEAIAYSGTVEGMPLSTVVLVERGGIVAGNINALDKNYQIRYRGPDFGHELREFDPSTFRDHDVEPPVPPRMAEQIGPSLVGPGVKVVRADDGSMIDLMVVYTPAARIAAGGAAAIQVLIALAVTETNTAYNNGNVIQRVRVVHTMETSYTEADGNLSTDLQRITNKNDGFMDEVHAARDQYGADLVSLWVASNSFSCGTGWFMDPVGDYFESAGFNVVKWNCATGNYSFAHELGHNMGLRHDAGVDPRTTPFAYGHGYVDPAFKFRTVMAYPDTCGNINCARVMYFANPNINYLGFPAGNAVTANAKLVLDTTRVTVANFRASVVAPNTAPGITSPNTVTLYVGLPGSFTVTATGIPSPTLSITGALPASLSFNAATGVLSGTPGAADLGVRPVTFGAANGTLPNATQAFTLLVSPAPACTLDLDGNGKLDALTDGLMLLRAIFGLSGDQVTTGAIGTDAVRNTWALISPLIALPALDIDGNGKVDALTDGLLILRAMFGLTGTQVTNNALGTNPAATRNTWAAIRTYLNATCGSNFGP